MEPLIRLYYKFEDIDSIRLNCGCDFLAYQTFHLFLLPRLRGSLNWGIGASLLSIP